MKTSLDLTKVESAVVPLLERDFGGFLNSFSSAGAKAKELSDLFTKSRNAIGAYMENDKLRAAYAAHFTITNTAKSFFCLNLISDATNDPTQLARSFLDLGCGLGSSSLAASLFLSSLAPTLQAEFTIVDSSAGAIKDAVSLFSSIKSANHRLNSLVATANPSSLGRLLGRQYSVIFVSNLLNEIGGEASANLCSYLLKEILCEGGYLILIDPALKSESRALMALRDELLESNLAGVFSPCLHEQNCPMLKSGDRHWCHFYANWNPPRLILDMDAAAGTNHKHLKFSYLILQRPSSDTTRQIKTARVVSSLLSSRGKLELVACASDGGLIKLRRLDRNASQANAAFADISRGDVILVPKDFDLKKDSEFSILKKFQPS